MAEDMPIHIVENFDEDDIVIPVRVHEPAVGMGATVLFWTDRVAGTIIQVTARSFTVREDKAIRVDDNGMSDRQEYRYEPNEAGVLHEFVRILRGKFKGGWRERGKKRGRGVMIGRRSGHFDYSF